MHGSTIAALDLAYETLDHTPAGRQRRRRTPRMNVTPLRRKVHEAFTPLSRAPRPEGKCQGTPCSGSGLWACLWLLLALSS